MSVERCCSRPRRRLPTLILLGGFVTMSGCGGGDSSDSGGQTSLSAESPGTQVQAGTGDPASSQDLENAIATFAEAHAGDVEVACPLKGADSYFASALPGVDLMPSLSKIEWMNERGDTFIACTSGLDMFDVVVGLISSDSLASITAEANGTDFQGGTLWVLCDEPDICDALWVLDERVVIEAVYTFHESEYPDRSRDAAGWLQANLDQLIEDTLELS